MRGHRVPIVFEEKPVEIDPWIIGHWLGDGNSDDTGITTADKVVVDYYKEYFSKHNLKIKTCVDKRRSSDKQVQYQVTNGTQMKNGKWTHNTNQTNFFTQQLVKYNLLNNKHIPDALKYNCRKVQLAVLAGLIDSDGYYKNGCFDFTLKSERLLDDVVFIAQSLGFMAEKKVCQKTCTNSASAHAVRANPTDKFGRVTGTYYRTTICGQGLEEIPIKIDYKKSQERKQIKNALVSKLDIEKLEEGEFTSFTLAGSDGWFMLSDFQVAYTKPFFKPK